MKFKPEDFKELLNQEEHELADLEELDYEVLARFCNEKIQRWLNEAPIMHIRNDDGLYAADQSPSFARATHTGRLVCVEENKTKPCLHTNTRISEPHLAGARECIDCGAYYNPNQGPDYRLYPKKVKKKIWIQGWEHEYQWDLRGHANSPKAYQIEIEVEE